jgi:hypothetical protein
MLKVVLLIKYLIIFFKTYLQNFIRIVHIIFFITKLFYKLNLIKKIFYKLFLKKQFVIF